MAANLYSLLHVSETELVVMLALTKGVAVLAALAGLSVTLARRDPPRYLALSMTMMSVGVSIALFARLTETRALIETIPFLLLGACLLYQTGNGERDSSSIRPAAEANDAWGGFVEGETRMRHTALHRRHSTEVSL